MAGPLLGKIVFLPITHFICLGNANINQALTSLDPHSAIQ